jgi:hypothetical protein
MIHSECHLPRRGHTKERKARNLVSQGKDQAEVRTFLGVSDSYLWTFLPALVEGVKLFMMKSIITTVGYVTAKGGEKKILRGLVQPKYKEPATNKLRHYLTLNHL